MELAIGSQRLSASELASDSGSVSETKSESAPLALSARSQEEPLALRGARSQEVSWSRGRSHNNIYNHSQNNKKCSKPFSKQCPKKECLKQLLRKRGRRGGHINYWDHVRQCIAENPSQVTEHLLRKVMHMHIRTDRGTNTETETETETDRRRKVKVKEDIIISMVDILQGVSVKTLEVAFFRMTTSISKSTSCSISTSTTSAKITHGISNEVKEYLLSHCDLNAPWYKCSCLDNTRTSTSGRGNESGSCKLQKPSNTIAMVSHLLFSYGCKHAWKYLTIPEFLSCMSQLLEVQVQMQLQLQMNGRQEQKEGKNGQEGHEQDDQCDDPCVICYVTIIAGCTHINTNDENVNATRNRSSTSVSTVASRHHTQGDYMEALLFHLLHDDGDIGSYIGSGGDGDSDANTRSISTIKSAARRQLNSRILLDMMEEPWLFCYLLSIYPQCLHTMDNDGRYLLYDLANYNPSMVGLLPLVLGRCLQLKVGFGHESICACPLGGLLCNGRPNRSKRQDGHAEIDETAFERLLSTDYHWDSDYPMEVIHAVLQVVKKHGGMELLTIVQMELIRIAINLKVQGCITTDLFPAIVDYFSKDYKSFTSAQKPLIEMIQSTKRLPLHHAIAKGMKWNGGVDILLSLHFEVLHVVDGATGLYPFLLAAASNYDDGISNCGLTCIFKLARADPGLLRVHH